MSSNLAFTQTAQEGTSTDFGRVQSQRLPCTSLAASANLLSSFTAFKFDWCNYLRNRRDVKAWTLRLFGLVQQVQAKQEAKIICSEHVLFVPYQE
jgi:hypothetical protein